MMAGQKKSEFDELLPEEQYTDTSMFNADEIVKNIEKRAKKSGKEQEIDERAESRRKFEALQEQKRLEADLRDLEDYDISD